MSKPFAIVAGAPSGIGLELAAICAQERFDLLAKQHRWMAEPGSARKAESQAAGMRDR
jgi:NAD(P)-dependent dehydrogenase (short-subunit alcohol dehydrogenase family)